MKNFWILILYFGFQLQIKAQSSTKPQSQQVAIDTARIEQTDLNSTDSAELNMMPLNTSLDYFHLYQPVYKKSFFNTSLSNNGAAWQNLIYQPIYSAGFDQGFQTFNLYQLQLNDARWYDCQSPYTHAAYVQGQGEEMNFSIIHTQNIQKEVNLGLTYQRIASQGFYQHQATNHQSLLLHTWLRPSGSNYQAMLAGLYQNGIAQENGGITSAGDTLFRDGIENRRVLIPVNLSNARNKQFGNGFLLHHFYDFRQQHDSLKNGFFRIQHNLQYRFRRLSYEDKILQNAYYPMVFDSSLDHVAYSLKLWDNELALLRFGAFSKSSNTVLKLFYRQQFVDFASSLLTTGSDFDVKTTNQSLGGLLRFKLKEGTESGLKTEVFFAGFNRGDGLLTLFHNLRTSGGHQIEMQLSGFRQEVNYQLQRFVSNFAYWNSPLNKYYNIQLKSKFLSQKGKLLAEVTVQQFGGYTYLNISGNPIQFNMPITMASARLLHRFQYGKWHLYSHILIQLNNKNQLMRLPHLQIQEGIFREGKISGKTIWRVGMDFFAVSTYRPDAYQVFSGLFYLQNQQLNQNLYQADIYVSAKIRRARVFVKLEHFNSGWGGYRVIPVPGYPLNDRSLKLGLSWMFFD